MSIAQRVVIFHPQHLKQKLAYLAHVFRLAGLDQLQRRTRHCVMAIRTALGVNLQKWKWCQSILPFIRFVVFLYYRNIKSNVNSPPPMQLQGTLHMCAILMVSFSDCRAATSVPLTCRVVGNDFCVFYGPTQTEQMFSSLTTGFSLSFFFLLRRKRRSQ